MSCAQEEEQQQHGLISTGDMGAATGALLLLINTIMAKGAADQFHCVSATGSEAEYQRQRQGTEGIGLANQQRHRQQKCRPPPPVRHHNQPAGRSGTTRRLKWTSAALGVAEDLLVGGRQRSSWVGSGGPVHGRARRRFRTFSWRRLAVATRAKVGGGRKQTGTLFPEIRDKKD
ncbi:hypothetical protein ZWY2020_053337 [Hordeum vulgare]|nr:hypothetical protein ZWY2020_053337 [Hordeum vulgare]